MKNLPAPRAQPQAADPAADPAAAGPAGQPGEAWPQPVPVFSQDEAVIDQARREEAGGTESDAELADAELADAELADAEMITGSQLARDQSAYWAASDQEVRWRDRNDPLERVDAQEPEAGPSRRRAPRPEEAYPRLRADPPDDGQIDALAGLDLVPVLVPEDGQCQLTALLRSAPEAFLPDTETHQLRERITRLAGRIIDNPADQAHGPWTMRSVPPWPPRTPTGPSPSAPWATSAAMTTSGSAITTSSRFSPSSPRATTAAACWTCCTAATGPVRAATSPFFSPPTPTR